MARAVLFQVHETKRSLHDALLELLCGQACGGASSSGAGSGAGAHAGAGSTASRPQECHSAVDGGAAPAPRDPQLLAWNGPGVGPGLSVEEACECVGTISYAWRPDRHSGSGAVSEAGGGVDNGARFVWIVAVPEFMSPARLVREFLSPHGFSDSRTARHCRGGGARVDTTASSHTHGLETIVAVFSRHTEAYSFLMRFASAKHAAACVQRIQGHPFSPMHDARCHAVAVHCCSIGSRKHGGRGVHLLPSWVQLPTCVMCLERLDVHLSGMARVGCDHLLACSCSAWGTTAKSCRCCATVAALQSPSKATVECASCKRTDRLWACLVCGHVGCARYAGEHAVEHFHDTGHNYSVDLQSRRVWDYVGDRYAHRVSTGDIGDPMLGTDDKVGSWDAGDKLDTMTFEFGLLLASQLEAQSLLFHDRMVRCSGTLPPPPPPPLVSCCIVWRFVFSCWVGSTGTVPGFHA